ncbi:MAG: cell wall hydrolase [Eubacteriales bacterium]
MKRRTSGKLCSLLLAALLLGAVFVPTLSLPTYAATGAYSPSGYPTVTLTARGATLPVKGLLIRDIVYIPLQPFLHLFTPCTQSYESGVYTIRASGLLVSAAAGSTYIKANNRYLWQQSGTRVMDGTLYVPIRMAAKVAGLTVSWSTGARTAAFQGTYRPLLDGNAYYDGTSVYWLSRIISAEAMGEPLLGQIAVGSVVLNRVRSPQYPNSIYGVIFDTKYGVQFTPISNGTIYHDPAASAVIAAKICLEGHTVSNDVLFFLNPRKVPGTSWIARSRPYAFTIGGHDFYY